MQNLIILTKLEEIDSYSHVVLIKFPKYEKYVLCSEIRTVLSNIIKLTIRAKEQLKKPEKN
jgi:hypothetical protein